MKSVPTSSVQWKSASSLLAKRTLENPQFLSTSGNTKRSRTGEKTLPGSGRCQLTLDIGMEGGRDGIKGHTSTRTATSCHRCLSLTGGNVAPGSRNLFIAPNRNNILKVEAFRWRPLPPDGRAARPHPVVATRLQPALRCLQPVATSRQSVSSQSNLEQGATVQWTD